jgi:hypothetical protein
MVTDTSLRRRQRPAHLHLVTGLRAAGVIGSLVGGFLGCQSLVSLVKAEVPPQPPGCQQSHLEVTASASLAIDFNGQGAADIQHLLDLHRLCDDPTSASHQAETFAPSDLGSLLRRPARPAQSR